MNVKVRLNTKHAKAAARTGTARGLFRAAEHTLQTANTIVPNEEGTLERSGTSSLDASRLTSAVSYDTPYAVAQHEDLSYEHKGKGQAKYLENAANSQRSVSRKIIADAIRGSLR